MPVKSYKPTTPARRGMTSQDLDEITTKKPLKSLLVPLKSKAGRNNSGRITVRHRGGGAKRSYRMVSFGLPANTTATVEEIEYDPIRTARIARIKLDGGEYRYVLATKSLQKGQSIATGEEVPIKYGNRLPLSAIPVGTTISCVEVAAEQGGQIARSAGASAQLVAKEGDRVQVRLPSGEVRLVPANCTASIGPVGNENHQNIKYGSAGRMRRKGRRPTVRGVVMNAVDHPHGGGDGGRHNVGGGASYGRAPRTPWGQKTIGLKTRRRKRTNKLIVRSRRAAKRRQA